MEQHKKCPKYQECKMYMKDSKICNKMSGIVRINKICSFFEIGKRK